MKTLVIFFSLVLTLTVRAQEPNEIMYQAYLQLSKSLWVKALDIQKTEAAQSPNDFQAQLKLAYAYSSLLNGSMALNDEEFFDEYLSDAKKHVKKLVEKNPQSGEAAAILSSIYGNEMGYSPMKGMTLGSKSNSLAEKGITLEPHSPLVWRVYANSKYYTPKAFGGDINEAIQAYEKCIAAFEAKPEQVKNNWMYIDTMAFLGQVYKETGRTADAIRLYEKALTVEPNFLWVKKTLLPAAQRNMASK